MMPGNSENSEQMRFDLDMVCPSNSLVLDVSPPKCGVDGLEPLTDGGWSSGELMSFCGK